MITSGEQKLGTAIIRNPRIGMGNRGFVTLRFDCYISPGTAASQHVGDWPTIKAILETVGDISQLEGKPCWVDITYPGMSVFHSMWEK